jgi:MFS family permease
MVAAGGGAFGVLLGGVLTQYLSWRWNFFINVPVGLLVGIFALRLAPAHEFEERSKSLDLPGAVLITSALILLVYTLSKASVWGWYSGQTIFFLAGALALLIGFVINEYYARHPLIPLSVFNIGNITPANMTQLPITAALFAMFFFLSLYIQQVLGYSPVLSGLSFLPVPIIIAISAMLAPRLLMKVGYKPILVVAPLLLAAGLFILSHVPVAGSYWNDVLPGMAIMAAGMGFSFVSLTVAATTGIPMHQSGLASGLLNTSQQIGGAVGLAILSSVAASKTAATLALDSTSPLAHVNATVAGFQSAFGFAILFAFLASFFALVLMRNSSRLSTTPTPIVFE